MLLRSRVTLVLQGESGDPLALRLEPKVLRKALLSVGAALGFGALMAIMFFRELEINRKLTDRSLRFEVESSMRGQLVQSLEAERLKRGLASSPSTVFSAPPSTFNSPPEAPAATKFVAHPITSPTSTTVPIKEVESVDVPEPITASSVNAKLAGVETNCNADNCDIDVALIPSAPGNARGLIAMVLEVELPQIGGGNPLAPEKKRYLTFPGKMTLDTFTGNSLNELETRPFKFSRALHTRASFSLGRLHRPLAINVYVFDPDKNLVVHERKTIESDGM